METGADEKLVTLKEMKRIRDRLRREGKRLVFTNGCFDILHVGHVRYLTEARARGDCLVVGLNADSSVSAIKGELRPLNDQESRATVLAALACVDHVVIFEQPDPLDLISELTPDVLVKGADWAEADIVGADLVRAAGGTVARIPLTPGASTTGLIDRIVRIFGGGPQTAGDR